MGLLVLAVLAQWAAYPGGSPQDQYVKATSLITARQYGEATAILNELAPLHPKWAELYAARCSAQLGLNRPETAVADCRYALGLKPRLYVALFGLATAEEKLKQNGTAAQHYQQYAAATGAGVDPALQTLAARKAESLAATAPPPPVPRAPDEGSRVSMNRRPLVRTEYDQCASSLDCDSGGACKDRGDGIKVCFEHGGAGESCASASDCSRGLACRERPDGTSVCQR